VGYIGEIRNTSMSILPKQKDLFTNTPHQSVLGLYKAVLIHKQPVKEAINALPSFSSFSIGSDGIVELFHIFDMRAYFERTGYDITKNQ